MYHMNTNHVPHDLQLCGVCRQLSSVIVIATFLHSPLCLCLHPAPDEE